MPTDTTNKKAKSNLLESFLNKLKVNHVDFVPLLLEFEEFVPVPDLKYFAVHYQLLLVAYYYVLNNEQHNYQKVHKPEEFCCLVVEHDH